MHLMQGLWSTVSEFMFCCHKVKIMYLMQRFKFWFEWIRWKLCISCRVYVLMENIISYAGFMFWGGWIRWKLCIIKITMMTSASSAWWMMRRQRWVLTVMIIYWGIIREQERWWEVNCRQSGWLCFSWKHWLFRHTWYWL